MKNKAGTKVLKRLRGIPILLSTFHYGSLILKAGVIPFSDVVYEFIVKYLYDDYLGIVIKPLCDMLWGWKHYDMLYRLSGLPSIAMIIVLTLLIRMIEKAGKIVKKPTYEPITKQFGVYGKPKTSIMYRARRFLKKNFGNNGFNISKEGMDLVFLRVISGNDEKLIAMNYEKECKVFDKMKAVYDSKEDMIILESDTGHKKTLYEGDRIVIGSTVLHYL